MYPLEKFLYFLWGFPFEKLQFGGYQRIKAMCYRCGWQPAMRLWMVIAFVLLLSLSVELRRTVPCRSLMGWQSCRIAFCVFQIARYVCHETFFSPFHSGLSGKSRKYLSRIEWIDINKSFLICVRFSVDYRTVGAVSIRRVP